MKTLENKKVYVGKHSKEIQEKAFELGWVWFTKNKTVKNLDCPFLYFNSNHTFQADRLLDYFNEHEFEEITAEEILAMEVPKKEETFEPFQKVLVRSGKNLVWKIDFYSSRNPYTDSDYKYLTAGGSFIQCLNYETNKHLLGTTDNP